MTSTFKIILLVSIVVYFCIVLHLLKKKRLVLKYVLLWLFLGAVMLILVLFPSLLITISSVLGIESTMNGLFTCAIGLMLMILMALTAIVSKQSNSINKLVQDNALLEKRIREIGPENTCNHAATEENT